MSAGKETYAGYLDTEEQAFKDVMDSLTAMKRLLAQQSREVRSWRFKVQNWRRSVNVLDTAEAENQLTEDEATILNRSIRALTRVIEQANSNIGSGETDRLEKTLQRVVKRAEHLRNNIKGAEAYADETMTIQQVAEDNLALLQSHDEQEDKVTREEIESMQEDVVSHLQGLAKVNQHNLLVEVDERAVSELSTELLGYYADYPENGVEAALERDLWSTIGTPDWTETEAIVEDGDTSSYRPIQAIERAIVQRLENYIDQFSVNDSPERLEALESESAPKPLDLELLPKANFEEAKPAQSGVSVTLLEELEQYLRGPYTRTEGHEDEINELVVKIGHNCPKIEKRSITFDVARDRAGLSDALDELDNARNLFGKQRHSSKGRRLVERLNGAWEACYAVSDKSSLDNAQRRMRSTQRAMLNWWSNSWNQRGGTPDNDNTYTHWKNGSKLKALY